MNRLIITILLALAAFSASAQGPIFNTPSRVVQSSQITGTATNDSAPAGRIGELITGTLASGSAISMTNNTPANITQISLTPGDWDVNGLVNCQYGATTNLTAMAASPSTTSATLGPETTITAIDYGTAGIVMGKPSRHASPLLPRNSALRQRPQYIWWRIFSLPQAPQIAMARSAPGA